MRTAHSSTPVVGGNPWLVTLYRNTPSAFSFKHFAIMSAIFWQSHNAICFSPVLYTCHSPLSIRTWNRSPLCIGLKSDGFTCFAFYVSQTSPRLPMTTTHHKNVQAFFASCLPYAWHSLHGVFLGESLLQLLPLLPCRMPRFNLDLIQAFVAAVQPNSAQHSIHRQHVFEFAAVYWHMQHDLFA